MTDWREEFDDGEGEILVDLDLDPEEVAPIEEPEEIMEEPEAPVVDDDGGASEGVTYTAGPDGSLREL